MSSFTVDSGTAAFTAVQEGYSSSSGALEQKKIPVVVESSDAWGALFGLVTPRDLVSVRTCRGAIGAAIVSTTRVDVGGGAGEGTLVLDNIGTWSALLVDLQDEAFEVTTGRRLCQATFLITSAAQ